jgi:hypothetical protein
MHYSELAEHSKVWIYQSNRSLDTDEVAAIVEEGRQFISNWAAHGSSLNADFQVFHRLFLVIFADESSVAASGCSIDTSVNWIKGIAQKHQLQLFDRMQLAYRKTENDPIQLVHLSKLDALYESGELIDSSIVFNNLVNTKSAFNSAWEVPFKESWCYQRLTVKSS